MKHRLLKRLEHLKTELQSGQQMLADLEARRQTLQQTLLRISGAIQVLEEECADEHRTEDDILTAVDGDALRIATAGR